MVALHIETILLCAFLPSVLCRPNQGIHYVPANARAGHVITVLPSRGGERISLVDSDSQYEQHFRLLKAGELVTSRDLTLSSLGGVTIMLQLQHSHGDETWHEHLSVQVTQSSRVGTFERQPYRGHVMENQPAGSKVIGLDELQQDLAHLPYGYKLELISGHQHAFSLSNKQGSYSVNVVTSLPLDREQVYLYYVVLAVVSPSSTTYAMIKIDVFDQNDNPPLFSSPSYIFTIPESLQHDTMVGQLTATDKDLDDPIQYSFTEQNPDFLLGSDTGAIFTNPDTLLVPKSYAWQAIATDSAGHTAGPIDVIITVEEKVQQSERDELIHRVRRDVTDREQQFPIRRNKTGEVLTVRRSDDEETLRYHFSSPAPLGLDIHDVTGVVSRTSGHEWSATDDTVIFNVQITKEGDSSYDVNLTVRVELNERGPYSTIFHNTPTPIFVRIPKWIRPGTVILTLQSSDVSMYGVKVAYMLEAGGDGYFEVDADSGDITIRGRQEFQEGAQFNLGISAIPEGVIEERTATPAQLVVVQVDDVLPQFYVDGARYYVDMSETTPAGGSVLQVSAKSFQELKLEYTMEREDPNDPDVFFMRKDTGLITLKERLAYVESQKQYRLNVTATEEKSGLKQTTQVVVKLAGENEHTPYFPVSYVVRDVRESQTCNNQQILTATAVDPDPGDNGLVDFSVSDDNFIVEITDEKTAIIRANGCLDYDFQNEHMYEFMLMAVDRGEPARTGSTTVQVWVENDDDEGPYIFPSTTEIVIKEKCPKDTVVHVVQAFNPEDRDNPNAVTYSLSGTAESLLAIDTSGRIEVTKEINKGETNRDLTVTVRNNVGRKQASQEYVVKFAGINNPPKFPECNTLDVEFDEENEGQVTVVEISAEDDDTGENGKVNVSLVWRPNYGTEVFDAEVSGNKLTLKTKVKFDRENPPSNPLIFGDEVMYRVTVQATDAGVPPLSTTCFFFVKLKDINDEAPRFDKEYSTRVVRADGQGDIIRVFAMDYDAEGNNEVTYSLTRDPPECPGCFEIDANTGWIRRRFQQDIEANVKDFSLTVMAQDSPTDGGVKSSTTTVKIKVQEDSTTLLPEWEQYNNEDLDDIVINIRQDVGRVFELPVLFTMKPSTLSSVDNAHYYLQQGASVSENNGRDFLQHQNSSGLRILTNLVDYDKTDHYILRVTGSDQGAAPDEGIDARIRVNIIPVNNHIPIFEGQDTTGKYRGAVSVDTEKGDEILKITAIDKDADPDHKRIQYSFKTTTEDFLINPDTGVITANRGSYNTSHKDSYVLYVEATDGEPSHTVEQRVAIVVIGGSVAPPFFDKVKYTFTLQEARPFGHIVGVVMATDPDPAQNTPQYDIIGSNINNNFGVETQTGMISVLKDLIYKQGESNLYTLTYRVFDGIVSNSTEVEIRLLEANAYAPVFDQVLYELDEIKEEDSELNYPHELFSQFVVTDQDHDVDPDIAYKLGGEAQEYFDITSSGVLSLVKPLDRDYPYGHKNWLINVVAEDECPDPRSGCSSTSRRGFAVVQLPLTDINDNAPEFIVGADSLEGSVDENSNSGTPIMTVSAHDVDESANAEVTYELDSDMFLIHAVSGEISTSNQPLDREDAGEYRVMVTAKDKGTPTPRSVSLALYITVTDTNDNRPVFTHTEYTVLMKEELPRDSYVTYVSATDEDVGDNARLGYSLSDSSVDEFYVDSIYAAMAGSIKTNMRIDFDNPLTEKTFDIKVKVEDPGYSAETTVHIEVVDVNDNAPMFDNADQAKTLSEDSVIGTTVVTFSATDADSGVNRDIGYFIDYQNSDLNKFTYIDEVTGVVTVRNALDRELEPIVKVHVLAIDKGKPAMTGSGTLTLTVTPGAGRRKRSLERNHQRSPRQASGSYPLKQVYVYNYMGQLGSVDLGQVHDSNGKYEFAGDHDGFLLEGSTLKIQEGAAPGDSLVNVEVGGSIHQVEILVNYITQKHVDNAGSVRFTGISAEEFVSFQGSSSPWGIFRSQMADWLNTTENKVHVYSVSDVGSDGGAVDVLFSGPDRHAYRKSKLNGLLWKNKQAMESAIGAKIEMSPVDLCASSPCWHDGCVTGMTVEESHASVITPSASLIGPHVTLEHHCQCGMPEDTQHHLTCEHANACLNGGVCDDTWNGYTCTCPPGYHGPRCQMLKHSFHGDGWIWLEPLSRCEDGSTSLEVITRQGNGLLLYNGPMLAQDAPDFISLELKSGYPLLRVNLGEGELSLTVDGRDKQNQETLKPINDGEWHTIDIFKTGKIFSLVVDHCSASQVTEQINGTDSDRKACEATGSTPREPVFLDVSTPLQLGGRYISGSNGPTGITNNEFNGCIRNVWHNGMLYDLAVAEYGEGSGTVETGCDRELGCTSCTGRSTCTGSMEHQQAECVCHPGFTGQNCSETTETTDFYDAKSFIEWELLPAFNSTQTSPGFTSEVTLTFTTRQPNGQVFTLQSFSTLERIIIQIVESHLVVTADMGAGDVILELPNVNVSDGIMHAVKLNRYGNQLTLHLDGGEGRFFAQSRPIETSFQLIRIDQSFAAAHVSYKNKWHTQPDIFNDVADTCISDVRYHSSPLPIARSGETKIARVDKIEGEREGCVSDYCDGFVCPGDTGCVDYWRLPHCVCPPQTILTGAGVCTAVTDCSFPWCENGYCVTVDGSWMCHCWGNWTGDRCGVLPPTDPEGSSSDAYIGLIVGIIFALLIILAIVVLLIIYCLYCRKSKEGELQEDFWDNHGFSYDDDGAGEADMDSYDLTALRKPMDVTSDGPYGEIRPHSALPLGTSAPEPMSDPRNFNLPHDSRNPELDKFLSNRMNDADFDPDAPPFDSLREYDYEGGDSQATSLSSLVTSSSGSQDFGYLNDLGPRFRTLASMYNDTLPDDEDASTV